MKDTFCVAGWNPSTQSMKRLLINGKHWTEDDLKKIGKYAMLLVNVISLEKERDYPHKTEDIGIDEHIKVIKTYVDPAKLASDLKNSLSSSIDKAFKGSLINQTHVPSSTKCPSLGAVTVPGNRVEFYKDGHG